MAAPLIIVADVWDNADLLPDWLDHHRALGVEAVVVSDMGSTDGTLDILADSRWNGFVEQIPYPGRRADVTDHVLTYARASGRHGWALTMDVDEFLVTPTGDLRLAPLEEAQRRAPVVSVPRFHMGGRQSAAAREAPSADLTDLTLRWVEQDMAKVMVDLASEARTDFAGHQGIGGESTEVDASSMCLLHAPTRSYERFAQKVDHADVTLRTLDHLDEGFAFHWRRWIRIRDEGGLRAEYLAQFVDDEDVPRVVAAGEYAPDDRLADLVRAARAGRA